MSNIDEIYYIEENCFAEPWTRKMLESELKNSLCVLTAETCGEKLCGFALGRVVADEAELFKIAVLPEYRRQGIAEKLLISLHKEMKERGAKTCFLEVRAKNAPALALYKKLGYEKIRVISRYYPDDDAAVMRAEL